MSSAEIIDMVLAISVFALAMGQLSMWIESRRNRK